MLVDAGGGLARNGDAISGQTVDDVLAILLGQGLDFGLKLAEGLPRLFPEDSHDGRGERLVFHATLLVKLIGYSAIHLDSPFSLSPLPSGLSWFRTMLALVLPPGGCPLLAATDSHVRTDKQEAQGKKQLAQEKYSLL